MVWDLDLAEFTLAVVGEPVEKALSSRDQSLEWDASSRCRAWLALGPPLTLGRYHRVFSFEGDQRGRRKSRNKWVMEAKTGSRNSVSPGCAMGGQHGHYW